MGCSINRILRLGFSEMTSVLQMESKVMKSKLDQSVLITVTTTGLQRSHSRLGTPRLSEEDSRFSLEFAKVVTEPCMRNMT